jgi:hypothetical protein
MNAHAFRLCSASRVETMLALFPPERSDHAFVHAVWAWREGSSAAKLTPAIEAVDDRLRRQDRGRFRLSGGRDITQTAVPVCRPLPRFESSWAPGLGKRWP